MIKIKKIGVFTSGGDAPGMNAAIRAVVRTGINNDIEVIGILQGYSGMIKGDFVKMETSSVSNIIQRGGTILKTARSEKFFTIEGRQQAFQNLKNVGIDALVAIGGDGTFTGAEIFSKEFDFPIIGMPGTIDNDLYGSDYTIGFDTALNTVVEAADKIRDTAYSHNRLFIIEVMGRDAGFIALQSGIAVGAEDILIPESKTYIDSLLSKLRHDWRKNKTSGIIIVAEGDDSGGAFEVAKVINEKCPDFKTRITILGHVQRGGSPSCLDRVLASTLGYHAVKALLKGNHGVMVGRVNNKVVFTPFEKATKLHQEINKPLLEMARVLSL
ncbi:MAG: 6-phosphofructokinase [Bacteroidales bacterium]|nr:6-phosphofructokinase [Bacteroidales bacterium]